jgi:hypothetical protein
MWLAAIPLLLIPACWLFWWVSGLAPGISIGRSASLLLVVGAIVAALLPRRQGEERERAERLRAVLGSPATWCIAALAWQYALWLVRAPVREPGLPWLLERGAALAAAWGLAELLRRREPPRAAWGVACAGAVVLVIAALGLQGPGDGFGIALAVGMEPPFGNPNFAVGGALPLLALSLGLWWRERQARPARVWQALIALGWLAALVLAIGARVDGLGAHLGGNVVRATWVGIAATVATLAVLAAPPRWHAPLLVLGAMALWGGEALVSLGVVPLDHLAPSTLQRIYFWNAAAEAIAHAPITGYGAGAAVAVLPEQPAFAAAFLAVPSWTEHPHHEILEALLDGGAVNLALLAVALATTILPLWRRRGEALPCALLSAWAAAVAQASVERHLSEPGPLMLLALLAGLSWACASEGLPRPMEPRAAASARRGAAAVAALALGGFIAAELAHLTGSVAELEARSESELRSERPDWTIEAHQAEALRSRVGPLAVLDRRIAHAWAHLSWDAERSGARELALADLALASRSAISQARRVPVDPETLILLERLSVRADALGAAARAQELSGALADARRRARELLDEVPEEEKNRALRERLTAELQSR